MGVAERFHHEIEIVFFALKGTAISARVPSAAQDFLLNGCQASAFFTPDDFGIGSPSSRVRPRPEWGN